MLGVGIGWSREEFTALGIPFAGRARRTREFVDVMRTLWREDPASYEGELVGFREVRSFPKPVQDHRVPIILGGNSDAALDRVAAWGDGWYGFNLSREELPGRVDALATRCRRSGRDPATVEMAVSLRDGQPEDITMLTELGVTELVVVESPPDDPGRATAWVEGLAERWGPD